MTTTTTADPWDGAPLVFADTAREDRRPTGSGAHFWAVGFHGLDADLDPFRSIHLDALPAADVEFVQARISSTWQPVVLAWNRADVTIGLLPRACRAPGY